MKKKIMKINAVLSLVIIGIMLTVTFMPIITGADINRVDGFDKGPSYLPVVPMKKVTMVNFDEDTYLDDYAYLASVPSSVFNYNDKLYSNPLLFYQEELEIDEEKEVTLDARKGLNYFMEDWMSYCNDKMDQMTLINLDENDLDDNWNAKKYITISGETASDIANQIALADWSYSDDAVIAVIEDDFQETEIETIGEVSGTLHSKDVKKLETFNLKQTNSLNPVFYDFDVDEGYKYMEADCWWDGYIVNILIGEAMIPTGDPDIQLYCKYNDGWMQTSAAAAWNIYSPIGHEPSQAYVYKSGSWRVGVTDMPTEGETGIEPPRKPLLFGKFITQQGTFNGWIKDKIDGSVTYHVDITLYPGVEVEVPDLPPFGCRDAEIKLRWDDDNVNLGFTLVGPGGEAIITVAGEPEESGLQEIDLYSLGECLDGESYVISVFSKDDLSRPLDFTVEYSWKQKISQKQGDALASATEGSVLASTLNAPLLYVNSTTIDDDTISALYMLGVENIYLVDFGGHISEQTFSDLEYNFVIKKHYELIDDIIFDICEMTGSNDIVFTTIDPWTYWYMKELKPGGETDAGMFIGPAAYIAAHHGTPVLIVDMHPQLSSAVTYHNVLWRHFSKQRYDGLPSSGEMVLTGKRIYDFLRDYNFDREGDENIITVADQFDIGVPWDRIFIGVANSGRFCGSPVDTAYWISRNMFYPALVFENPAMQGKTSLIQGSTSSREGIRGLLRYPIGNSLVINEGGEEKFEYPVLCSFVTQKYRFNERASKYYGSTYECADGLVPGESPSFEAIDMGSIKEHTGKDGSYFADMSETEMVPFYLERGGYDPVLSTSFDAVSENLNRGVLLWIHASHGSHGGGGNTDFWNVKEAWPDNLKILKPFIGALKEENPQAGYEWMLGSTEEPDTMTMDIKGIVPFTNWDGPIWPAAGWDYVLARKPVREQIVKILPDYFERIINEMFPRRDPLVVDNLYDGVTGSFSLGRWTIHSVKSPEMDEKFGNLHSVGFITNICQTAYTNFQLTMIRHGSVFQVEDPWATSWYATVWRQSIPRDLALGYTMGEAFARGIKHVGILYLGGAPDGGPQWWWDTAESVIYFGDPELRPFVPNTDYSDANYWEQDDVEPIRYDAELSIGGHMPFGATSYPNEKQPKTFLGEYLILVIAIVAIVVLIGAMVVVGRKKK